MVKNTYCNDLPPITAPANNGQDLQVPSRPLSRGYTVYEMETLKILMQNLCSFKRYN